MQRQTLITVLLAIFLGVVAVVLTRIYIGSHYPERASSSQVADTATVNVVLAATSIERGQLLDAGKLKLSKFPSGSVPTGVFHSIAEALGTASSPRQALRPLTANEILLSTDVSGPENIGALGKELQRGMRAISIRSNDVTGVGGFVLPGDHVDVILTRTVGQGDKSNILADILVPNALVLGVDQVSSQDKHDPVVSKSITIQVTPEQAQAISMGQMVGSLTLSLRHPADRSMDVLHTVSADSFRSTGEPKTQINTRSGVRRRTGGEAVNVFRGVEHVTTQFASTRNNSVSTKTAPMQVNP